MIKAFPKTNDIQKLDIASQGNNVEEARNNLVEALELFFETADPSEIERRLHKNIRF